MGSEKFHAEERPVHEVAVDGFWMDWYTVTNEEFARFVDRYQHDPHRLPLRRASERNRERVSLG